MNEIYVQNEISTHPKQILSPCRASSPNKNIQGVINAVDEEWMRLLVAFRTPLEILNQDLKEILFVDGPRKFYSTICGKQMVFRRSIERNGYRIIPGYPEYGINKHGEIFDFVENIKITAKEQRDDDYIYVRLRTPSLNGERKDHRLHRLVALAWVKNKDPISSFCVNHIDGNKGNFYPRNLEWVTYSENIVHSVKSGLRDDNVWCRVRSFSTGKITRLPSISSAFRFMGLKEMPDRVFILTRRPWNLYNDEFEIRIDGDDRPWFYEGVKEKKKLARYQIFVRDQGDLLYHFNGAREFYNGFKLYNLETMGLWRLLEVAKERNPNYEFTVEDLEPTKFFQVKNLKTNEVYVLRGIKEVVRYTKIDQASITVDCEKNRLVARKGFLVRYLSDKEWGELFVSNAPRRCIEAEHLVTGEKRVFKSLRKVCESLGFMRKTIKAHCESREPHGMWKFRFIEDTQEVTLV